MKFITIAALIGATSASKTDAKVDLRSEMISLLTLVKTVDSKNKDAIFTLIDTRKNELKALVRAKPDRWISILN